MKKRFDFKKMQKDSIKYVEKLEKAGEWVPCRARDYICRNIFGVVLSSMLPYTREIIKEQLLEALQARRNGEASKELFPARLSEVFDWIYAVIDMSRLIKEMEKGNKRQ